MQNLILRLQFIDRAGRFVYHIHPLEALQTEESDVAQLREGPVIGMMRTKPLDDNVVTNVEWLDLPTPASTPQPDEEEPGPHQGGTG